jgi:hypothetical protein
MMPKRIRYIALSLWELIRLVLVIIVLSSSLFGTIILRIETLLLFLLLGSGNLLIPAGALYFYFTQKKSVPLSILLVVGKIISLFPCFLSLLVILSGLAQNRPTSSNALYPIFAVILVIIFFIDLIFIFNLLSLKEEDAGGEAASFDREKLPDHKETEIPKDT